MTSTDKTDASALTAEALTRLTPPTDAMLFDRETGKAIEELDRIHKRGPADARSAQEVLEALNAGPPVMYTRGGGFGLGTVVDAGTSSFLDAFLGLYVPVEGKPTWLPASQRYMHEQTWMNATSSAVAHKTNGKLAATQSVDTTVGSESAWAGVYASFQPEPERFGTLSRVTIDPEITWTGRDILDFNPVWSDNIDGFISFTYRLWTVVYELNIANGQWEPLLSNQSAAAKTVAQSTWHINSGGAMGHAGQLRNGDAALAFVVEPGRTYLFGVVAQMWMSHSLQRTDGQPIPQPSATDLYTYGTFKLDVPAMYMSHLVLAK